MLYLNLKNNNNKKTHHHNSKINEEGEEGERREERRTQHAYVWVITDYKRMATKLVRILCRPIISS